MYSFLISGYSLDNCPSLKTFSLAHDMLNPVSELSLLNPSFAYTYQDLLFTINEVDDQAHIQMYLMEDNHFLLLDTLTLEGGGLCHIIFHPTLPIGYIITEYSNKIFVAQQNTSTGTLHILQEITTLPRDYTGESYCSNCIVLPNQKYLLAANRGHNSLTHFEILEDGTLNILALYSCEGIWPRHIDCTPDGKLLIVCNQKSNEVIILNLDGNTSSIKNVIKRIPFSVPSFVKAL